MLVVLAALVVAGLSVTRDNPTGASRSPSAGSPPSSTLGVTPSTFAVAPSSLIATLHGSIPSYATPTSPTATGSVVPTWAGATLGLPVIGIVHGRCQIRLLQRPNDRTTWVAASAVSLTHTNYHLVVDLSAKRLLLYERSKLVLLAPAVVGSVQYPTPMGHFFVVSFAPAPNPAYGPFVVVTSAFANTVTDWEQEGEPVVTISGPLDTLAAIQAGGAALSHGGIRLLDRDVAQLRALPAGTPIDVVATLSPPQPARTQSTTPVH